jgi:phosphohistidine swiveling domain-containing protein
MKKNSFPRGSDYEFTYEGKGTTFLFEDIVRNFYMTCQSLGFYQNGTTTSYISKKTVQKMKQEGARRTQAETKRAIKSLLDLMKQVEREVIKYQTKKDFSEKDAKHMLELLGKICSEYYYFDFSFWDTAFEKAKKDKKAAENVKLVEGFKNVIRDKMNAAFFTPESYLGTLLRQVHEKTKVPISELDWYTHQEVIALFSGAKPSRADILSRQKASAYYVDSSLRLHLYSGEQAQEFIDSFSKKEISKSKSIIKGMVAHGKGKIVKGTVRVLYRDYADPRVLQKNMKEMGKGEILVSQTTDPTLMPAFHKASAVITDVGGMLSHAAITARELNLPCIVGTGSASKILKTGDYIEVDTTKGVIKILK